MCYTLLCFTFLRPDNIFNKFNRGAISVPFKAYEVIQRTKGLPVNLKGFSLEHLDFQKKFPKFLGSDLTLKFNTCHRSSMQTYFEVLEALALKNKEQLLLYQI